MEIREMLREPIKAFTAYKPGGKKLVMRDDVSEIIALNANENQLGPSPKAVAAMQEAAQISHLYPFSFGQMEEVRQFIADHYQISSDCVMITSGSSGIISAFGEIFLNPGDEMVTCVPTYDSYRSVANRYGAVFKAAPLKDHTYDLEAMLALMTDKTKLAVIVNPNNPTGTLISNQAFDQFMDNVPDHVITVIDEAYFEWIGDSSYESALKYLSQGKKVAILKTFSKLYGMAGARIGYGLMSPEICQFMRQVEFNYGVSRISLAGAMAALQDTEYVARSLKNNTDGRAYLTEVLRLSGFDVVPSFASFVYFLPKGISSEELVERLAAYGVMIRQFGEYSRVSVGLPHQNHVFATTLQKVLAER